MYGYVSYIFYLSILQTKEYEAEQLQKRLNKNLLIILFEMIIEENIFLIY